MNIKYNNKKYNKIKELLADTTVANIDKFLFNNKKITLADFVNLQEKENKEEAWGSASNSGYKGSASNSGYKGSASNSGYKGSASNSGDWGSASNSGYKGSASNSGDWGSASNSGDWGVSISNSFFGKVTNKAKCYSMITEFVLDNNNDLNIGKRIIKQNCRLIKFTKKTEGKFYTLLKNNIYEVVNCDNLDMIVLEKRQLNGYNVLNGMLLNDYEIYNIDKKIEDIKKVFVVEKDGTYSHGKTIDEAIADFRYKISNRDTTSFEYLKTTENEIPTDEIIKGYRVITGACEFGTKEFVKRLGELKDKYTIQEALSILRRNNAYGLEKFESFLKEK